MRRKRGTATIEFAIMTPLILLLLAGVLDYTMLMRTAIAVAGAARAGAQYGSLSSASSSDIAGMQNAAVTAAPDVKGLTATAAKTCQCSDGTATPCPGSCITGTVRVYVKVTARTTVSAIFSYGQLPYSGAVSCTASMRAR